MDATKERGAIEALSTRWLEAERQQDSAALLEMVTDDAVFLLPNGQSATGRSEIGALFGMFFAGFTADHSATIREIRVLDGWAWAWGVETMVLTPKGGGQPIRLRGFGFSVMRRGDDGQWRFARGINNLAPEMTMPAR